MNHQETMSEKTDEPWDPLKGAVCAVETLMQQLVAPSKTKDILGSISNQHLKTGGKRFRARLALEASLVLEGAMSAAAIAWAAACELAHHATLIHDDIQDEDEERRGKPTLWKLFGVAQAINAGDLLFMLPYRALAVQETDMSEILRWRLAQAVGVCMEKIIRAQAQDLYLASRCAVTAKAFYEQEVLTKTSPLFELPVYGAALLKGDSHHTAAQLAEPFEHIGFLFQLQNDVLDLYPSEGRKARGSDLRSGKVSALVLEHVALYPQEQLWLQHLLRLPRDQTPETEVDHAIQRFQEGGALAEVLKKISSQAASALEKARHLKIPAWEGFVERTIHRALGPIEHLLDSGMQEEGTP